MIIIPSQDGKQNSAYRHQQMKGAFGNEGALPFMVNVIRRSGGF
jgi:hypothetical protein